MVEQIMSQAAEVAGVQIWAISFHRFNPTGVSGVVVISESHLSVHTWPETGYVALDIFTCGQDARPTVAVEHALRELGAKTAHITEVTRGLHEGDQVYFHSIVTWEEDMPGVNGAKNTAALGISPAAGRAKAASKAATARRRKRKS